MSNALDFLTEPPEIPATSRKQARLSLPVAKPIGYTLPGLASVRSVFWGLHAVAAVLLSGLAGLELLTSQNFGSTAAMGAACGALMIGSYTFCRALEKIGK